MSSIREFYEIDEKEGIVVNKRLGKRAFVFGVEPWTSLVHRLFETFGSGAETILFDTGKFYGISSAEEEKRTESDNELRINFLFRKAMMAGWGKVMVLGNYQIFLTSKSKDVSSAPRWIVQMKSRFRVSF